jgi:hypothetical protein
MGARELLLAGCSSEAGRTGKRAGIAQPGNVPVARPDNFATTATADDLLNHDTTRHPLHHLNRTSVAVVRPNDGRRAVESVAGCRHGCWARRLM